MNFSSTDSVASCIGFVNNKANGATPMSDDIISDGDEFDRPVKYNFTSPLRMIEMLRADNKDVTFLTLNHFTILLIIFEMDDERFGIEAQTIHSLAAVEKSTANRIVHSLSDKGRTRDGLGYIRVDTDVNDRRIRRIFLTKKGRFLKQQMTNAGTQYDNQGEVQKMHQAYDATRMQSLEKASESYTTSVYNKKKEAPIGPYSVKPKGAKPSKRIITLMREQARDSRTAQMALDRSMKAAMNHRVDWVRYNGTEIPLVSAEELRESHAHRTGEVDMLKVDGYWMLFETTRAARGDLRPECIQQNLTAGTELVSYMNGLMRKLTDGFAFSDIMGTAAQYLNQTQYNRLRNRMTRDLADTRDTLMRDTERKTDQINILENVSDEGSRRAGTMHRMAAEAMNEADKLPDTPDKSLKILEALDLAQEGAEQNASALKIEIEAQQLRNEKREMQKALDNNAKAMAEMQAMMKQLTDKGE